MGASLLALAKSIYYIQQNSSIKSNVEMSRVKGENNQSEFHRFFSGKNRNVCDGSNFPFSY